MKIVAVVALLLLTSSSAYAQVWRGPNGEDGQTVRVSVNIQVSTPVDANADTTDLATTLSKTNQPLAEILGHQCDIIAAALKGTCSLAQLSISSNVNGRVFSQFQPSARPGGQQIVSANANATFVVEPTAAK